MVVYPLLSVGWIYPLELFEGRSKSEKDRSNFITNTSWYNSTSMVQPYYNWMTGAAHLLG